VLSKTNIAANYEEESSMSVVMMLSPDCNILSHTHNAENLFEQNLMNKNIFDFIHEDDISKCEMLIDSITPDLTLEVDFRIKSLNDISKNNRGVVFQLPHEYSKVMNELIWVTIPQHDDAIADYSKSLKKYNFVIIEDSHNFSFNSELTQLLEIEKNSNLYDIIYDRYQRNIDLEKLLSKLEEGEILSEDLFLRDIQNNFLSFSGSFIKHTSENKDFLILILTERDLPSNKITEFDNSDITELEQKIQSRDKFFSVIAHDLRSPFTAILGYSEYMASYYENLTREEIHDFSNNMFKASKSVFKLLEDLLKWTRIQSGKISLDKEIFSLVPILSRAVEMFKATAENKNIRLIFNLTENDILVNADAEMISSVFRNLISNGIKFTDAHGFVKVDVLVENGYVIISVIDNGIGIDKVTLSKLFKVGERVTRYGTSDEEGSGLGLILSKEFIQKNGGDIWVESQMGEGSKFSVKLPLEI